MKRLHDIQSLNTLEIVGIGSLIRDLELLSENPEAMEQDIVNGGVISEPFKASLGAFIDAEVTASVGDIIVFSPTTPGPYPYMETLWGAEISFEIGKYYLGVLCECGSSRHITAEIPSNLTFKPGLKLQLVSESGGVGFATGSSPKWQQERGNGVPSDVIVIGAVYDIQSEKIVNTVCATQHSVNNRQIDNAPPTILFLGTGTDVGKTTAALSLIEELSTEISCAAVKASGTGGFEDVLKLQQSGAFPAVSFVCTGLPTTYYVEKSRLLSCMYDLLALASQPEDIPAKFLHPSQRERVPTSPEVIIVEHGGDLIWGGIPEYLEDKTLMASVVAIVLCSESAVSLVGALEVLASKGVRNSGDIQLYASVPHVNREGFYKRVEGLIVAQKIAGVFDTEKPNLARGKHRRCGYSVHYEDILSRNALAQAILKHIKFMTELRLQ